MPLREKFADILEKNRHSVFVAAPMAAVLIASAGAVYEMQEGSPQLTPHGLPHRSYGADVAGQMARLDEMQVQMTGLKRKIALGSDMDDLLQGAPSDVQTTVAGNVARMSVKINDIAHQYATSLLLDKGINEFQFQSYAAFLKEQGIKTKFNLGGAPYLKHCQHRTYDRASEDHRAGYVDGCMKKGQAVTSATAIAINMGASTLAFGIFPFMFLFGFTQESLTKNAKGQKSLQSRLINKIRRIEKTPEEMFAAGGYKTQNYIRIKV